jgi:hypothetical protein
VPSGSELFYEDMAFEEIKPTLPPPGFRPPTGKSDTFRMRRQNEPAGAGDAARELRRARME